MKRYIRNSANLSGIRVDDEALREFAKHEFPNILEEAYYRHERLNSASLASLTVDRLVNGFQGEYRDGNILVDVASLTDADKKYLEKLFCDYADVEIPWEYQP